MSQAPSVTRRPSGWAGQGRWNRRRRAHRQPGPDGGKRGGLALRFPRLSAFGTTRRPNRDFWS